MSDEEDYEFEYSDEDQDQEDDLNVQIENNYYNAKALDNPEDAIEQFNAIIQMEEEKGEWGFKSLKRIIKLHFQLHQYNKMMTRYEDFLGYTKSAVCRNVGEKGINSILDHVSHSENNVELLERFYTATLNALKEDHNDRLWFKTNVKLGKLFYETKEFTRLAKVIKELLAQSSSEAHDGNNEAVEDENNNLMSKKGTQLLEVYALQIQMYTAQKDTKKLKTLYEKALRIKSAIPHPKIVGVIRECGGKMYMNQKEWEKARTDFFEGFKSFDEAGEPRRLQCLKYLVLTNMLSESKINIFDSQEAKPYENDRDITAMTHLADAFLNDEIKEFEQILQRHEVSIMQDPFIRDNLNNLLRKIRSKVLIKVIRPYTNISLGYVSRELNGVPEVEVEKLIVTLILDGKIQGRLDQVERILILHRGGGHVGNHKNNSDKLYRAMKLWSDKLQEINQRVLKKAIS